MAYEPIRRLEKSPLEYVVGMVITQPIANLQHYIPQIQDTLRKNYPNYHQDDMQGVQIELSPTGIVHKDSTSTSRYVFSNVDKTWGVVIQSDKIFFHTIAYTAFEDFSSRMKYVLEVYSACVGLDYYSGVGIRYIDKVEADDQYQISDILDARFLPLEFEDFKINQPAQGRMEFFNPTEHGALVLRSNVLSIQMNVPQDLADLYQQLKSPEQVVNGVVLDTDHCSQGNALQQFDVASVLNKMDEMHKGASYAFRKAINPNVLKEWADG